MNQEHPKILLFEDNDSVSMLIKKIAEKFGYTMQTYPSGYQALEKTISYKPNIVLMDIWMEGVNGIDAMREIKGSMPEMPIVGITGATSAGTRDELLEKGFDEVLLKPFHIKDLIEVLEKWIIKSP